MDSPSDQPFVTSDPCAGATDNEDTVESVIDPRAITDAAGGPDNSVGAGGVVKRCRGGSVSRFLRQESVNSSHMPRPPSTTGGGRGDVDLSSSRLRLPNGVACEDYARPLYRADIFYSGSILQLPQYKSQQDVHNYSKSVMAIPAELTPAETAEVSCLWRNLPLWREAKHTLMGMTDCSLLNDPLFLITAVSNLLCTIGLYVPFVYVTDRAVEAGVSPGDAAFLLSIIGGFL